jgi:WD40 repeat protein
VKRVKDLELGEEDPYSSKGTTDRMYCVKFNKDPENEHILYSAGWDQSISIWDMRAKKPVDKIFGPLICGDGIDNAGLE